MCHFAGFAILLVLLISGHNGWADASNEEYQHYDGFMLYRAIPATSAQLQALQNLSKTAEYRTEGENSIEFWKFSNRVGMPSEIFVARSEEPELRQFLKQNQIAHHTLVHDFGIQMREAGETARFDEPEGFVATPDEFDLGRYHRYESIVQYLQSVANANPHFASISNIGKTFEGRELAMLKLGYASQNGTPKPMFLLDAGIHAREWIAPAVALHAINAFVNLPEWHSLLRQIDVHIIPVLNPDGYIHSWNKDRLWRRTRSGPFNTEGVCAQDELFGWALIGKRRKREGDSPPPMCFGADPNRNFPFHWAESGTEACPCSEVFPGPGPLSEVECANLAAYMDRNKGRIKAYLSLHSYGNLLIHGWNYAPRVYPHDLSDIKQVANQMAAAILAAGGPAFTVGSGPDILYEAAGGSDDYASSLGIKYSYTMELTNGQFGQFFGGFIYPEKGINQEAAKVLPGIHVLAAQVNKMTVK